MHVRSSQDDCPGERGCIDAALLQKLLAEVLSSPSEIGAPKQRVHYERFALR